MGRPKPRVVCAVSSQSSGKYRASRPYGSSATVPVAPLVRLQYRSKTYARFSITGGTGATKWRGYFRSSLAGSGYVRVDLTVGQTYIDLKAVNGATVEFFVVASNSAGSATSRTASSAPIALPANWSFYGDSQTQGPAALPCKSHATAFQTIWQANFASPSSVNIDGAGGTGLAYHRTRYEADSHTATEWTHVQESGGQDEVGQMTLTEFRATFIGFMEQIALESPNGIITYETAYSFEREATAGRDWNPWNVALREDIEALASRENPIHVILVDADAVIKRLVADLGYAVVNQTAGQTPVAYTVAQAPYHYTEVGNLAIALAMFKALNYDIRSLNLSSVTTGSSELGKVSAAHVAACIEAADPRLVHGGKFTVLPPSGVSFGSFTGKILAYVDPEQYTTGVTVSGLSPALSTDGLNLSLQTGQNTNLHVRVNNNRSSRLNGTKSIFIDWDHPDNTGSQTIAAFGINTAGIGDKVFVSFKKYMEGDYTPGPDNHKDMYIFGTGASELPQFLSVVTEGGTQWALYNNDAGSQATWYTVSYGEGSAGGNSATASDRTIRYADTQNKWCHRDFYVVNNSAAGVSDGSAQAFFNGMLCVHLNANYAWQRSTAGEFADIRIGHMAQGFTDTAQANFDEVYMATTPARVEITTQASYDSSVFHKKAIQPHTSWTTRGITVMFNEGDLPDEGPLYARVFDNDNNLLCVTQIRA